MYCYIGYGLLGSMLACMILSNKGKYNSAFENLLNSEQKQKYNSIKKERLRIYFEGQILGVILALLLTSKVNLDKCKKICLFITVILGVNYLYYILHPKSDYILRHLNCKQQIDAWLKQYIHMKNLHKIGFILGLMGYVLIGKSLC